MRLLGRNMIMLALIVFLTTVRWDTGLDRTSGCPIQILFTFLHFIHCSQAKNNPKFVMHSALLLTRGNTLLVKYSYGIAYVCLYSCWKLLGKQNYPMINWYCLKTLLLLLQSCFILDSKKYLVFSRICRKCQGF